MVKIVNFKEYVSDDGRPFFVLEVQGGIELVKSKQSGNYYATVKKATIPSTFDEDTCISLVGTELSGRVVKIVTEPYDYTVKETGEIITLQHKWEFVPEESPSETEKSESTIDDFIQQEPQEAFSLNGVE